MRYTPKTAQKVVMSIFLETVFACGDKNITDLDYGGDNLTHPYTHVFGKIFVAASVIIRIGLLGSFKLELKIGFLLHQKLSGSDCYVQGGRAFCGNIFF